MSKVFSIKDVNSPAIIDEDKLDQAIEEAESEVENGADLIPLELVREELKKKFNK